MDAYNKDEELTIFGDGKQSRDFIHVSDVAMANWLALTGDLTGNVNIATGEPKTLLKLIEYLEAAGKNPARLCFEPGRTGDIKSSYAATQKAEQHLGFRSSVSLEDGMKLLVQQAQPE